MKICLNCRRRFDDQDWECPGCHYEPEKIDGHIAFAPRIAEHGEGFNANYFATLFELEPNSFWFRSRNRLICWALERYFPRARSLLEVGCGTGFVLAGIRKNLPDLTLAGSEIFAAGLRLAAQRLRGVRLFQMDAQQIPFESEFDIIGAFDVLEHVTNDELVLSQMYQAVRDGGGILLTVPQHPFLWSRVDEYSKHVRRYTAVELKTKVRRAGFSIARATSFVSLLLPLMLISRARMRRGEGELDSTEVRLSAPLDFLLELIMDCERAMIRCGIFLPAGGSLLLIAKKSPIA
jgi:SAM-dependent methyltransferase